MFVRTGLIALLLCAFTARIASAVTVSGHVIDWYSATPIAAVTVAVTETDPDPLFNASTTTDANGNYQLDAPSGEVYIAFATPHYSYFSDQFTLDADAYTYNVSLLPTSTIRGTVRRVSDGSALVSQAVTLLDANTKSVIVRNFTAADGTYSFGVQPYRDYAVCVLDPNDVYLDTCYDNVLQTADGTINFTVINLSPRQDFSGTDFSLAFGGVVDGNLHDRYFNTPIANTPVTIELYSTQLNKVSTIKTTTDDVGDYVIYGVAPGSYYLTAGAYWWPGWAANTVYRPRLYGGGDCADLDGLSPQSCPFATASLLAVDAFGRSGVDLALFPGYVVSGRVTDSVTGAGLANVSVKTCDATSFVFSSTSGATVTDANGDYVVAHAVGGNTRAIALNAPGYINQIWPSSFTPPTDCFEPIGGNALNFGAPGSVLQNIDFALPRSEAIAGTVTASDLTSAPLSAQINVFSTDGQYTSLVASLMSGSDGAYITPGLAPGMYFVVGYYENGSGCQVYDHTTCGAAWNGLVPYSVDFSTATAVVLDGSNPVRNGIDLQLSGRIFRSGFE